MATTVQNTGSTTRLQFIDNIRWALIVLVIIHHSAVTYSHVGSWYYNEGPAPGFATTLILATFLTFNQAYFMGFLFLIAGYFVPAAFDRKGFGKFVRDRAFRLGVPSLLYMLVIHPVIVYWLLRDFYEPGRPPLWKAYGPFLSSGRVLSATGPMWFAVALLFFCIAYALFWLIRREDGGPVTDAALPSHRQVIRLAFGIAFATFLIRIGQPVGTSVLNMQLCNFSQYIALFAVGIVAYRWNWLLNIRYEFGMSWLRFALFAGVPGWGLVLLSSGVFHGEPPTKILGGLHWQSALNCLWESFFCMGMSLGVLVLFRDKWNVQGNFAKLMTRNAFAAYLFHPFLLIAVTLALRPFSAPPLVKFAVAGIIAVVVTFVACEFVFRRIPLLKRIL
jgi:glucans biosynthesis protein C